MTTTESVNVLEQEVEVRGGWATKDTRSGFTSSTGPQCHSAAGFAVGWHPLAQPRDGLEAVVELQPWASSSGARGMPTVARYWFYRESEAKAEFERIKSQLWQRQWVEWVTTDLAEAGLLPDEFRAEVLTGEPQALMVAADWQDEQNQPYHGHLLRAAYHMIATGAVNVPVRIGKKAVVVLNPNDAVKPGAERPGIGSLRVAEVVEGESVRIVCLAIAHDYHKPPAGVFESRRRVFVDEKVFSLGDPAEYDSFNLAYYAPILSITAKTVVLAPDRYGSGGSKHRLTLAKFVGKNHDFDMAKAQKRNDDWTD